MFLFSLASVLYGVFLFAPYPVYNPQISPSFVRYFAHFIDPADSHFVSTLANAHHYLIRENFTRFDLYNVRRAISGRLKIPIINQAILKVPINN